MPSKGERASAFAAGWETLRQTLKRLAGSPNRLYRCVYHVAQFASRARVWADPRRRSEVLTRLRYGGAHFQGATYTSPDRYPILFGAAASYLRARDGAKILSFGCSTGDEVASLHRYVPGAEIVGVDINSWCLKQARRANAWPTVSFVHQRSPAFAHLGGFDAIFCLAVFQRTENRRLPPGAAATAFTFDRFESMLTILDAKLKVGGLLVVCNADFAVEDTVLAARFQVLPVPDAPEFAPRTCFDRTNAAKFGWQVPGRLFVKLRSLASPPS